MLPKALKSGQSPINLVTLLVGDIDLTCLRSIARSTASDFYRFISRFIGRAKNVDRRRRYVIDDDDNDVTDATKVVVIDTTVKLWSLPDKRESLACQITSPVDKKLGCLCMAIFSILFMKTPQLIVE